MKYSLQELRELAERYSMSFNTLKNYRNNPPKLNSIIIAKIAEEREITVEQFEEAFKSKNSIKSAKITMLTKYLIKEKRGIQMDDKPKLNIIIESEDVTWLRDGEQVLMGYENIDQLIKELDGIVEIDDDFNINLLDEEKLTEAILFL